MKGVLTLGALGVFAIGSARAAAPDAGKPPFSAGAAAAAVAAQNEARRTATRKADPKGARAGTEATTAAQQTAAPGKAVSGKSAAATKPATGKKAPSELERLLLASETPPTASALQALGPTVDQRLIALARGPNTHPKLSARAMSALAFTPTHTAIRFLEIKVGEIPDARDAKSLPTLRRAAIALGWIGPASAPALLARLYEHPDPAVREDATLALGLTRLPDAAAALRARLAIESDDGVRALIARQLQVVEASLLPARAERKAPR